LKIFITGSNGFIGSHLVKKALDDGHEVVGLRLPNHTEKINLAKQPFWISGNLESDLSKALAGCDVFIHLAAYGVNPIHDSWKEAFRWNVTASLNLWNQAHNAGIRKIILAGSCSEYGKSAERYEYIPPEAPLEPVNAYGASKAASTLAAMAFAREKNIELAVLRPFHIYGEGENSNRFFPGLKKAALEGADLPMTLGEQIRDFMPVEQAAEKFLNYATKISLEPGNPIIRNIGTGKPQSLLDFAELWWANFEGKGKILPGSISYRKNEIMRYVPKI
jgi:nucleoside-diphosphate-sugar epimerase